MQIPDLAQIVFTSVNTRTHIQAHTHTFSLFHPYLQTHTQKKKHLSPISTHTRTYFLKRSNESVSVCVRERVRKKMKTTPPIKFLKKNCSEAFIEFHLQSSRWMFNSLINESGKISIRITNYIKEMDLFKTKKIS